MHLPKQKMHTKTKKHTPLLGETHQQGKVQRSTFISDPAEIMQQIIKTNNRSLPWVLLQSYAEVKGVFLVRKKYTDVVFLPLAGTWTLCRCARPPARWRRTRWTWATRILDPCLRDHPAAKENKSRATFSVVNCSEHSSETTRRRRFAGLPDWV